MYCPKCQSKTHIVESRQKDSTIKRRRGCVDCLFRFNTYEEMPADLQSYTSGTSHIKIPNSIATYSVTTA